MTFYKKNNGRKLVCLLLSLIMLFSFGTIAFADEVVFDPTVEITENEDNITVLIVDDSGTLEEYAPVVHIPCDFEKIKVTKDGVEIESVLKDGEAIISVNASGTYVIYDATKIKEDEPRSPYVGPVVKKDDKADDKADSVNAFVDLKTGAYYLSAVTWAVENAITNGVNPTHFGPEEMTTRAQMVTFLWRAAGCPEPTSDSAPFTDLKAGSYYEKAVFWGYEKGLINGTSTTTFSPDDFVTRAQAVTFLWRYDGAIPYTNMTASGASPSPFTDVASNKYYYSAVLWAKSQGITDGTSANLFSPEDFCTRAQIVTFLWRYFVD